MLVSQRNIFQCNSCEMILTNFSPNVVWLKEKKKTLMPAIQILGLMHGYCLFSTFKTYDRLDAACFLLICDDVNI